MRNYKVHILAIAILSFTYTINAQSLRGTINDGVDSYNKKDYTGAETKFRKGIDKEYETFEGHFNLGDALYKQGKYDEAMSAYKNALALTQDEYQRSKVFHNVGNALLKSQKYKESVEAYANALKLDPDDLETKYNLSYALNMLKQQQQQNQDQNKDQDKNKDQQQQQQNQDQNKNKDQQQQQDQQQQNQQHQQQKPKEEISKEEAQRILQALKQNETDLQKELRKRKAKVTKKEKDW